MHNAVVSVWVRFGLKERAASKQLFRSSGQPQLNHQGHISSSQVSIRAGSFPLLSVHVICGERTQAPHTHTHSTPNSGFFLLRGDCEPPRCPNGVCLFIPLALWVWLHVGVTLWSEVGQVLEKGQRERQTQRRGGGELELAISQRSLKCSDNQRFNSGAEEVYVCVPLITIHTWEYPHTQLHSCAINQRDGSLE